MGITPLSSPLESPDLIQTLLPFGEIGATTASVSSVKMSLDNSRHLNQQVRHSRPSCITKNTTCITSQIMTATAALSTMRKANIRSNSGIRFPSAIPGSISELPELNLSGSTKPNIYQSDETESHKTQYSKASSTELYSDNQLLKKQNFNTNEKSQGLPENKTTLTTIENIRNGLCSDLSRGSYRHHCQPKNYVEFSLSSVGRSFIVDVYKLGYPSVSAVDCW